LAFEEVIVRRPFASRVAEFASDPGLSAASAAAATPAPAPQAATVTAIDEVFTLKADGLHDLGGREAGPPGGDQALGVELSEAAKRKLVRTAGTRTVAGNSCRDYRLAEPPAGPLKRLSGNDHDLVCIDETGLLLREETTIGGQVTLRKEAMHADRGPAPAAVDAALSTAGMIPRAKGGTAVAESFDRQEPSFLPDPPAPSGFTLAGKRGFFLPGAQLVPGVPPSIVFVSTVWAFGRGADAVTVEAGGSSKGKPPWSADDPSQGLKSPIGGQATSVLRGDGPEIRIDLGEGKWVRVRGSIPLNRLTAYAKRLPKPR
jgi:hypothetical protein